MSQQPKLRPVAVRVDRDRRTLSIDWEDGGTASLPAELLRVFSPSAEVQGHTPAERKLVWGKAGVRIADVVPTGRYAVRIAFDDGHDTGIFTWEWLSELSRDRPAREQAYDAELLARGLSRQG